MSSPPATTPILLQFALSHYCERARWGLDAAGMSYEVRNLVPGFHMPLVGALTGQTQVPVLQTTQRQIVGSGRILDWIESEQPEVPTRVEPAGALALKEIEDFATRSLGPKVRRLLYEYLLRCPRVLLPMLQAGLSPAKSWAVRAAFPGLRVLMRQGMKISPEKAARDRDALQAAFSQRFAHLRPGRYVLGERFSRADITVASLLAPLYQPPEYPLPWPEAVPAPLAQALEPLQGLRPWVLWIYAKHRKGIAA